MVPGHGGWSLRSTGPGPVMTGVGPEQYGRWDQGPTSPTPKPFPATSPTPVPSPAQDSTNHHLVTTRPCPLRGSQGSRTPGTMLSAGTSPHWHLLPPTVPICDLSHSLPLTDLPPPPFPIWGVLLPKCLSARPPPGPSIHPPLCTPREQFRKEAQALVSHLGCCGEVLWSPGEMPVLACPSQTNSPVPRPPGSLHTWIPSPWN